MIKHSITLILSLLAWSSFASSTNLKSTVIYYQSPDPTNLQYYTDTLSNMVPDRLNVGRAVVTVWTPANPDYAPSYQISASSSDSGYVIANLISKIPKSIELYIKLDPKDSNWLNYKSKNYPTTCNPTPSCPMENGKTATPQDGFTQVCNAISYAKDLQFALDKWGKKLTGIVIDQEETSLNAIAECVTYIRQQLQSTPTSSNIKHATAILPPLKLGWINGQAHAQFPDVDLQIIEMYDLYSGPTNKQCIIDTLEPDPKTIKSKVSLCGDTLFPGAVTPPTGSNTVIGGNIYSCSINNDDHYCETFNRTITPSISAGSDRATAAFTYILKKYPPSTVSTPINLTCDNTVYLFSTQYIGKMGTIVPADLKNTPNTVCNGNNINTCNCIYMRYLKDKTKSAPEVCGSENGFGAWNQMNWAKFKPNTNIKPYDAFIKTTTTIINTQLPNCSSSTSSSSAPLGIWQYEYIPNSWLPTSTIRPTIPAVDGQKK